MYWSVRGGFALAAMGWLLLGGSLASAQVLDPSLSFEPASPSVIDEVTAVVEFESPSFASGTTVTLGVPLIRIDVEFDPCLILCPPFAQQLEVSLGTLDAGTYTVEVAFQDGPTIAETLTVAPSPYAPTLVSSPPQPTDNDLVTLALGLAVEECEAPLPTLVSADVQPPPTLLGHGVGIVDLHLERVIGGLPCEPGATRGGSVVAPLGRLPPGRYSVSVLLETLAAPDLAAIPSGGDQAGELIAAFLLDVADAPEQVLLGDRFEVVASWRLPSQPEVERNALVVPRAPGTSEESALFGFLDRDNWELLVKVLDGCEINGHFWVYGAAATDLGFRVRVLDTVTNALWDYESPAGERAPAFTDVEALSICP
ncbi:MAG: hypothetical protein DWQ36_17495 [Acidobacteria bacterium]|nr:MAG: hypothetical protein DWQ30_16055 [Acidobacteriota bacterium]REK04238.1 MAG: hypothetical protein DWQ36_17495 [Acidobacteriota bacterium]